MKENNQPILLETDYLIVGCGATGMAFADVILTETNANIILIDKYHKPGGHWNIAYPFVRLHQPSAYYGVSSTVLGHQEKDEIGFNKGLIHLASGPAILAYYDDIMNQRFLPSGRVKFFPLSEYQGNGSFTSLLTNKTYQVQVNKKLVDATFMKTKVPANQKPNYTYDADVNLIPVNDLPKLAQAPTGYVIIGGGKTGVDAILWLLYNRVDPDKITWIVSRDAWMTNRKCAQPTMEGLKHFLNDRAQQFEAIEKAESVDDLFNRLEEGGVLIRIDKTVQPKMFRGATVSEIELEQLRRIKNVLRKGHVKHIQTDKIIFENETVETPEGLVYVDCSANALAHAKSKPVFEDNTITPQPVRAGQMVFSAAFIAHIEAAYTDEQLKNELCQVIDMPSNHTDWIKMTIGTVLNQGKWRQYPELVKWLYNDRLDGFSHLTAEISDDDVELKQLLGRIKNSIKPALQKLNQFAAELD